MKKTVLLSGYYGYNNIGDEAVLGGMLAGLRADAPDVTPVVLSGNPAATEQLHGVAALPRMQLSAIRPALRTCDLFISGGGSLLQDVTSVRSPLYYLGLLWLAQRAGVPTVALAQGMGPLRHPVNRWLARRILNRTRAITVRDAGSEEFLADLGVTVPPLEVTADPSFLLQPDDSARVQEWWQEYLPANRPIIGVALRHWQTGKSAGRYTAVADALAALATHTGAFLLFIPMQFAEDLPVANEMAGWTPAESRVLDIPLTPREMLATVGRCTFITAMRLHTLIFAVQRHVPALGLAYDPKVFDFALAAGLPLPPRWETITKDTLTEELLHAWDTRDAITAQITPRAADLTALAKRNIAVVREVLAQ